MGKQLYESADAPLDELMRRWPSTIPVFLRHDMLCVGCYVTPFHTISDACAEHGVDEVIFLAELAAAIRAGSTH